MKATEEKYQQAKGRIRTLQEILQKPYSQTIVDKAIERVSQKLANATKCESFYTLPFPIIKLIVDKYFANVRDCLCDDPVKRIVHLLIRLFKHLSEKQVNEAPLLLNSIFIPYQLSLDEYIKIIGSITTSNFCIDMKKAYRSLNESLEPDKNVEIEERDKHIQKLKQTLTIAQACQYGDCQLVSQILTFKPEEINTIDNKGNNLLHYAAQSPNPEIIEYLVRRGVSLDWTNNAISTPLEIAVVLNLTQNVKKMIELGASVNSTTSRTTTPLHIAAMNNNYEIVRLLLENGADKNARDENYRLPADLTTIYEIHSILT